MRHTFLRRSPTLAAWSGIVATLSFAYACSSASDPPASETSRDGGTVIPPVDGSSETDVGAASDAGAGSDVDAEAGTRICSDDGFCHSVVPKGQHLRGVWGDGNGIVWAVSLERDILRWDGASWKIHAQTGGDVSAIWGSGPTDVWIVTSAGVLHGQGASSATLVFAAVPDLPGDASIPIRSIWGTAPNDVWAVGGRPRFDVAPPAQAGRVLHYAGGAADGGAGWTVNDELTSLPVAFRGVWGSAGSGVWLHGVRQIDGDTHVRMLRRAPGAATWSVIDLPDDPVYSEILTHGTSSDASVWFGGVVAAGRFDGLWHGTSANSETFDWTLARPQQWERRRLGFWGIAANDTWAVGMSGLVDHWNGTSWQQAVVRVTGEPVGKDFWAIWGKDNDDFWVVGDEIALHRTNAGKP